MKSHDKRTMLIASDTACGSVFSMSISIADGSAFENLLSELAVSGGPGVTLELLLGPAFLGLCLPANI